MLIRTIAVVLLFACQKLWAGPLEDAKAAGMRGDYATSLQILRPLAVQGNATAQLWLGSSYHLGQGVAKDYAEALKWYRLSAAQGNADAQVCIGFMYNMGLGVAIDKKEALKWYRLAAERGNALGEFNIGSAYASGEGGVAKNSVEAVRWYRMAAVQGTDVAQCSLGAMYYEGQGLKQDLVRAYMWLSLGRSSPYAHDYIAVDTVAKSMTQEQVAAAQKMALECRERNFKDCE